jgi:predicted NBD/HSP70 family sugar kinase
LLDTLEFWAVSLMSKPGITTLGLGLSLPGQVDYHFGRGLLSPNVPITNAHSPARDLAKRLGLECVQLQEMHALCLAELYYGLAKGLDDFAMLDSGTGLGLGVMSGGRLLTGHSGLAGELGHITAIAEGGRDCGCGNQGCLETLATDSALAWKASQKLGRKVGIDELNTLIQKGQIEIESELAETVQYLSIAAAAVINLFNPATLFIHAQLFQFAPRLFENLVEKIGQRSLPPSFADCRIIQARGNKQLGAVAGIIQHLKNQTLLKTL